MKNAVVNGRKRKQIQINPTDKNKEQVDFVHKPNEHFIVELINLFDHWIIHYFYEWIIESTNQIIFPFMNLLVHWRQERLTCFDCNV